MYPGHLKGIPCRHAGRPQILTASREQCCIPGCMFDPIAKWRGSFSATRHTRDRQQSSNFDSGSASCSCNVDRRHRAIANRKDRASKMLVALELAAQAWSFHVFPAQARPDDPARSCVRARSCVTPRFLHISAFSRLNAPQHRACCNAPVCSRCRTLLRRRLFRHVLS